MFTHHVSSKGHNIQRHVDHKVRFVGTSHISSGHNIRRDHNISSGHNIRRDHNISSGHNIRQGHHVYRQGHNIERHVDHKVRFVQGHHVYRQGHNIERHVYHKVFVMLTQSRVVKGTQYSSGSQYIVGTQYSTSRGSKVRFVGEK